MGPAILPFLLGSCFLRVTDKSFWVLLFNPISQKPYGLYAKNGYSQECIYHVVTELTMPLAFSKILKEWDIEKINLGEEKGNKYS